MRSKPLIYPSYFQKDFYKEQVIFHIKTLAVTCKFSNHPTTFNTSVEIHKTTNLVTYHRVSDKNYIDPVKF